MISELEESCKQLHIAEVYQFIQEHCGSDPNAISILTKACQFELKIRMMNRQIRTLKQAGFPTQKNLRNYQLKHCLMMEEGLYQI
jgi:hypothetical protein